MKNIVLKFQDTNEENKPVTVNQKSNMSNIHQSIELSKNCDDLIYFVEDDYIHSKNSILELISAYEKFTSQLNAKFFYVLLIILIYIEMLKILTLSLVINLIGGELIKHYVRF